MADDFVICEDWPVKHDGDHMRADNYWYDADGRQIHVSGTFGIKIENCRFDNDRKYGAGIILPSSYIATQDEDLLTASQARRLD